MKLVLMLQKVVNRFLMKAAVSTIKNTNNAVYLTFDDGPEPEITEFVLDELDKFGMKATFFCVGENAEKNPNLMDMITDRGHAIGNHTHTHRHAYSINSKEYIKDVEEANGVLQTHIFRPPNGCLLFSSWLALRKKYKIIYWSIGSGDWCKENFNYEDSMERLRKTQAGDILLFHFSEDLQMGTKRLLPDYLKWLHEQGLTSSVIS